MMRMMMVKYLVKADLHVCQVWNRERIVTKGKRRGDGVRMQRYGLSGSFPIWVFGFGFWVLGFVTDMNAVCLARALL